MVGYVSLKISWYSYKWSKEKLQILISQLKTENELTSSESNSKARDYSYIITWHHSLCCAHLNRKNSTAWRTYIRKLLYLMYLTIRAEYWFDKAKLGQSMSVPHFMETIICLRASISYRLVIRSLTVRDWVEYRKS